MRTTQLAPMLVMAMPAASRLCVGRPCVGHGLRNGDNLHAEARACGNNFTVMTPRRHPLVLLAPRLGGC